MKASSKWLRRALLGGAALSVAATGAQADELNALKSQLEALQSRVNQLESTPSATTPSGLPQSDSWITIHRGSDIGWDQSLHARKQEYIPDDRGFTIAITPSADVPVPVHEVTVSGYVKGDFIYDTHADLGDSNSPNGIPGGGDVPHVRLHARQSRFRIKSKSDTAVGQVRTLIEGDFFHPGSAANQVVSNSEDFRLRHAWGEWDISPNTTIGIGQTWTNFMNLFAYPDTVDFFGPAGMIFARQGQIRLTYTSGPILFAIAVENPETDLVISTGTTAGAAVSAACFESVGANTCDAADNVPDFTARLQYDAPGGHKFQISGVLRNLHIDGSRRSTRFTGNDSELAWALLAAASINLADIATVTATFAYGDGIGRYGLTHNANTAGVVTGTTANPNINTIEQWAVSVAIALGVTDTTTLNVAFGYADNKNSDLLRPNLATGVAMVDDVATVHANLIWQPVSRFRMGVEGIYSHSDFYGLHSNHNFRFQFGAWFFF